MQAPEAAGFGNGPHRVLAAGMVQARQAGADVRVMEIGPVEDAEGEIGRSFEVSFASIDPAGGPG